jgi:hypothetical protein
MTKTEMKKICKPLNIGVDEVWADGFTVTAEAEEDFQLLADQGFKVQGIGIGYDYNCQVYTVYAYPEIEDFYNKWEQIIKDKENKS